MKFHSRSIFLIAALILACLLLFFLISAGIQRSSWYPGAGLSDSFPETVGAVGVVVLAGGCIFWFIHTSKKKDNTPITFTSRYHKISLLPNQIEYIESLNEFVKVHALDGTEYPTKVPISQWQKMLGPAFLRIHRSFLVNRQAIQEFDGNAIIIGTVSLPVSRNYQSDVSAAVRKASGPLKITKTRKQE